MRRKELDKDDVKISVVARGRVGVYVPRHPKANGSGYVLRSRYVVEQSIGRYLDSLEEVHHINGNKTDDRLENLEILSKSEHARMHMLARKTRKLDYARIKEYMLSGLGYRKIAKKTGYKVRSTRYACDVIKKEMGPQGFRH